MWDGIYWNQSRGSLSVVTPVTIALARILVVQPGHVYAGVLLIRGQSISVDLEANTRCVFFGCYNEILRCTSYAFKEITCNIPGNNIVQHEKPPKIK